MTAKKDPKNTKHKPQEPKRTPLVKADNTPKKPEDKPKEPDSDFGISGNMLLIITLTLAVLYFLFSLRSEGFYQQDEAAHYLSMKRFWHNPNLALSNWEKPGFKLVYALPALLGSTFVKFVNCLFAAFSCFFAYRVAESYKVKIPLIAFILLATQPFWVLLSFRNYSELLSAFLIIFGLYWHRKAQFYVSALVISYVAFVRQEFYPFLALYGLYLLWQKQFVAAVLLAVFPLVHNTWGWAVSSDPLYLLNQILKANKEIGDNYPRQGFEHYFLMSGTIYGGLALTCLIAYFAIKILQKKAAEWFLIVPTLLYFLMYCVFNIQSYPMGPSTAGNLRYLIIISPLIAVIGALAVSEYKSTEGGWRILYGLLPFMFLFGIYMTYEHNNIVLVEEIRDFKPLFGVILAMLLLLLPLNNKQHVFSFTGASLFMALILVRPLPLSEEDKTCQRLAKWFLKYEEEQKTLKKPIGQIFVNHSMFYYFADRIPESFEKTAQGMNKGSVEKAQKGDILIWDSHYCIYHEKRRPNGVSYESLMTLGQYPPLYEQRAADNTFAATVVVKK